MEGFVDIMAGIQAEQFKNLAIEQYKNSNYYEAIENFKKAISEFEEYKKTNLESYFVNVANLYRSIAAIYLYELSNYIEAELNFKKYIECCEKLIT